MASYDVQLKNGPGDKLYPIVRNVRTEMPQASFDLIDDVVVYVGPTTTEYVNGHRYQCVQNGSVYSWVDVTGENNTPVSGGNVNAFDGDLYTVRLSDGALTTVNFLPIRYSGDKDFNFGMKVTQATNTGAIAITCNNKAVWWSDGNLPPQFDEGNQAPAVSLPETTYMLRFHWDCDANALMGNAEYLYPAYVEMSPVSGTRGVFVKSGGTTIISSAMTISGGTLGSGIRMDVYNHGIGSDVDTISGITHVHSGGIYCSSLVSGYIGGYNLQIHDGGIAKNLTVLGNGATYVSSGGFLLDTELISYGAAQIYGSGINLATGPNGVIAVRSGGVITKAVADGGSITVHPTGHAYDITVKASYLAVSSGGTASRITLENPGYAIASSGGYIEDALMYGGTLYPNVGGIVSKVIASGGWIVPYSTGQLKEATLYKGAGLSAIAGTTATNIVLHGGTIVTSSGAIVNSVSGYGTITNSSGVVISGLIAESGCEYYGRGGAVYDMVVSGGTIAVSAGGYAENITNNSGFVRVYTDGVVSNVTVNTDANLVLSGGSGYNITLNSSAYLYYYGGVADHVTCDSGVLCIYHTGFSDTYILNHSARMFISGNGVAVNTPIAASGGQIIVQSKGTATAPTVLSGGALIVSSNGAALNVVSETGANVTSLTGGTVTYAAPIVSSKGVYTSSGTTAISSAMILRGGTIGAGLGSNVIKVFGQGLALDTVVSSGGRLYTYNDGLSLSATVSANGNAWVSQGEMRNTYLSSGGVASALFGGTMDGTTVMSTAHLRIYSGGTARNTLHSMGYVYAFSGGTIEDERLTGGYTYVYSSGLAVRTVLRKEYAMCEQQVTGSAVDTYIQSGGSMGIRSGGCATDTTLYSGGWLHVSGPTTSAVGIVTVDGGYIRGSSGGVISSAIINYSANLELTSQSVAIDCILRDPATVTWTAADAYINTGAGGGIVSSCLVDGNAARVTIRSSSIGKDIVFINSSWFTAVSGGIGSNLIISNGHAVASSGGYISAAIVEGPGAYLSAGSDGVVSECTISSGGTLVVYQTGSALDVVSMTSAVIYSSAGATITYAPYKRRLAALKSTGTQWIDTGIVFDPSADFEIQADTAIPGNDRVVAAGSYQNSNYTCFNLEIYTNRIPRLYIIRNAAQATITLSAIQANSRTRLIGTYVASTGAMTLSADGQTSSATAPETPGAASSNKIHLFSDTRTTGATMNPMTLYAVKVYKGGSLVGSFIPVIDNNDVACMFDEVSRTFFYNQGTGNFAFIELGE